MKRNRTNRFGLALLGCVTALALFVAPAAGGEIDDLKAQIKALMNRLEGIEAREKMMKADMKAAAEAVKTKAVATGDFPGSWKMPGSNTSVSFGGYVKLDAIYDLDQDLGDTFEGYGGKINLDGSGNPNFSMHAHQTRLRFDSLTPTKMGGLKTRIETDFSYGSKRLRMRHAYATLGGVLAGQTWSILGDENTYADTVEFDGPVGVVAPRKPQLRYTSAMGKNLTAQVAIEAPGGPTILKTDGGTPASQNRLPNLLAALRLKTSWGAINVSGLLGQVLYEDGAVEESVTISALHLGANIGLGKDTRLWGTVNVGQGGLTSMVGSPGAAILSSNDELEAMDSMGGFVGLTHNWSSSVSSGIYYGWVENDFEDAAKAALPGINQSLRTVHANVWWAPAPKVRVGVEFIKGWRETNGGEEGDASRLQLGLQYSF